MKREYDFSKAKRGPVLPIPKGKTRITIRLDDTVLDWFRRQVNEAGGGNYQTLINDALRQHIAHNNEFRAVQATNKKVLKNVEETLRRVIREEIRRAS